ncbi:MAG: DUF6920 family protein [Candidatus Izemoplasmatales bacterium]
MNFLKIAWYFKTLMIIGLFILIIAITIMVSRGIMNYSTSKKINTLYSSLDLEASDVIEDEDISHLPEPVYQWLLNSGVLGQKPIQKLSLKQSGRMRLSPDDAWLKPSASQEINVLEPGYVWTVNLPKAMTKGRDFFYQGQGQMLIKVAGLIPIVNAKNNDKINESSMHRFLMEISWYPTAAIADYIRWQPINSHQARAYMTYEDMEVYADFFFENNDIVRVETMRYKETDDSGTRELCIADLVEHKTFDGFRVPSKVHITWVENQTSFTWYELEITELKIN